MKELFNKEQKEYIINNFENMKYSEIAKNLGDGFTATQITGWLSNNGYKKHNRSMFSKSDKEYIFKNYKSMSYRDIGNNLGFSEKQIRHFVNHYLDNKNRKFDSRYFQNIDTPNKAYWLGFIFADGYVCKNIDSHYYEFAMELKQDDVKVLEDLNNELGGVHNISFGHYEKFICGHKDKSITDTALLRVYSMDIVNDLIKHNVVANKTNSKVFPKLDKYFLDFLRGYIDGDGCIFINKRNYLSVHITSCYDDVLKYISDRLLNEYNIKSKIHEENPRKHRLYIIGLNGMRLLDLIYYDSSVQKLDRKYQKYLLLKQNGSPYQK